MRYRFSLAMVGIALLSTTGCNGDDATEPGDPTPAPPATGALTISVTTEGPTPDPDGYVATIDDRTLSLDVDDVVTVEGLESGEYVVTIDGLQVNCSVVGGQSPTVSVAAGENATLAFQVSCPFALLDHIVFQTHPDGNHEVYAIRVDGTEAVNLTNDGGFDAYPAISPDGTRIAFESHRADGTGIYVMNADGSDPQRLEGSLSFSDPDWSPDGERLVVRSAEPLDDSFTWNIWVVNADGTDPVRVTSHEAHDLDPSWSPDGERIVFSSMRDGNREIYVIGADGSGLVRLTDHPVDDYEPRWSPDGTKIAFWRPDDGSHGDIYVMNADGTDVRNITNHPDDDAGPAWSPDGTKIVFSSMRAGAWSDVFTMNADGSDPVRVTDLPAHDHPAVWSPR